MDVEIIPVQRAQIQEEDRDRRRQDQIDQLTRDILTLEFACRKFDYMMNRAQIKGERKTNLLNRLRNGEDVLE